MREDTIGYYLRTRYKLFGLIINRYLEEMGNHTYKDLYLNMNRRVEETFALDENKFLKNPNT
jgi:hypothetical protein